MHQKPILLFWIRSINSNKLMVDQLYTNSIFICQRSVVGQLHVLDIRGSAKDMKRRQNLKVFWKIFHERFFYKLELLIKILTFKYKWRQKKSVDVTFNNAHDNLILYGLEN